MITNSTTLEELATIVSETLEQAGISATLSGGAAVSIYTEHRYLSEDLDFVTAALVDELKKALQPLGFRHTGQPRLSVFKHPDTDWYLEFPPAPLSFGGTYVDPSQCALINTRKGSLQIITPTQAIMDRLMAAVSWNDPQSLEQAILVAGYQSDNINWGELDDWVITEGIEKDSGTVEFYRKANRHLPG